MGTHRRAIGWGTLFAILWTPGLALANPLHEEYVTDLEDALLRNPADPNARIDLADALLEEPAAREALAELDVHDALHPGDHRSDRIRARALVVLRRYDEAEAVLDRFLASADADAASFQLRGQLRERSLRYVDALADYDAALDRTSEVDLHVARGRVLERMGDLEEAGRGYERARLAIPSAVVLELALLRVERGLAHYARALELIDQLLVSASTVSRWQVVRAEILSQLSRTDESNAALQTALALAEQRLARRHTPGALTERGRVFLAMGNRERAIADLSLAVRRSPHLDEARRLLETATRIP